MKLTTGILISILLAGNAMAQQASAPSFWDTLRAKIMGSPAPKPTAQHPAPPNGQAKPVAATNVKPSPVQPKAAAPVASASKTQAQPAQVQPVKAQPAQSQMTSASASKNQAPPAAKAASVPALAKNQASQAVQLHPVNAPATKALVAPIVPAKPADAKASTAPAKTAAVDPKTAVLQKVAENAKAADAKAADAKAEVAVEDSKAAANTKSATKEFNYTGQRDPFISPVRTAATGGSGCSTGKRCLAVDQINLKGVIKSDGGMIAVVTNSMDKAYFLRENDPVFNGYVVKITGDSVIFSETYEDKLGKPLTREVTKKLATPAV
jgi:Tfp pilus assembly protein PilP